MRLLSQKEAAAGGSRGGCSSGPTSARAGLGYRGGYENGGASAKLQATAGVERNVIFLWKSRNGNRPVRWCPVAFFADSRCVRRFFPGPTFVKFLCPVSDICRKVQPHNNNNKGCRDGRDCLVSASCARRIEFAQHALDRLTGRPTRGRPFSFPAVHGGLVHAKARREGRLALAQPLPRRLDHLGCD